MASPGRIRRPLRDLIAGFALLPVQLSGEPDNAEADPDALVSLAESAELALQIVYEGAAIGLFTRTRRTRSPMETFAQGTPQHSADFRPNSPKYFLMFTACRSSAGAILRTTCDAERSITMTDSVNDKLSCAVRWLREADGLLITAGAGMGVDSGLPDFRGADGFWRTYPALHAEGVHFEDIANQAAFRHDPLRAWGFYGHRLNLYRRTVPHRSFDILRRWGERRERGAFLFTSNVDGQFQKAGFADERWSSATARSTGSSARRHATRTCGRLTGSNPMWMKRTAACCRHCPGARSARPWRDPIF
jgi:hypothetical protein